MVKHLAYTPLHEASYAAYKQSVAQGTDGGFGLLMGKLEAALAVDAFDNDAVVKQQSKLSLNRRQVRDFSSSCIVFWYTR